MIKIIGLGAGDVQQLPIGVADILKERKPLFLRTDHHPMISFLKDNNIPYESFDYVYEKYDSFEDVYNEIIDTLLQADKKEDIIYAVPGHPCVAEYTVKVLLENKNVKVIGGQSFFDAMFASLKIDPIDGLIVMDGQSIDTSILSDKMNVIIPQVYDQMSASDVKLDLMDVYPDEYEVCIVQAAGSCDEKLTWLPLYEVDHDFVLNNLTTLFIPKMK